MDNRYEIAERNGMSREFSDWFFDNKKAGCGNVWFMMMAAMWEGWQGRAAMLQGADEKPELTVWYGSMPESNGKANWTAILHRKGEGPCMDGFTIDRSEYPGRVLYAADRVRYLIGEKSERPSILDYDADAHSGYVKPGNSPVIPDGWVACSERMPEFIEDESELYLCWGKYHKEADAGYIPAFLSHKYLEWQPLNDDCDPEKVIITHWRPLPPGPQQEKR